MTGIEIVEGQEWHIVDFDAVDDESMWGSLN
jgi:hypothetical protein